MRKQQFLVCIIGLLLSSPALKTLSEGLPPFTHTAFVDVGDHPAAVIAGDFDSDGDFDVVAANDGGGAGRTISLLENDGHDGFAVLSTLETGDEPIALAAADWNQDGHLDLAVANHEGDEISIFINAGDGELAEGSNDISILSNDGDGGFTVSHSLAVGEEPYSVAAGDIDGDSDIDLVVANEESHDVSILSNDGTGTFVLSHSIVVGEEPWSVALSDLDGEGDLDIITANADSNNISIIIINNGGA